MKASVETRPCLAYLDRFYEWRLAIWCTKLHPYGAENWRPTNLGFHEHLFDTNKGRDLLYEDT